MLVASETFFKLFPLFVFFITNVELRFVPNDDGHCEVYRTQADKSCFSLSDYNMKESLESILNSVYHFRFREALKQLVYNDFNSPDAGNESSNSSHLVEEIKNISENAGDDQKSAEDKSLTEVNRRLDGKIENLAVVNDEM